MARTAPILAKLTRPRLFGVLHRERLFAKLREGRERAVTCISGPPGSGKTALVASYLEAGKLGGVWMHLDGGDHDVATFLHFLSLALRATGAKRALPIITPEHFADLPAFTRYYFREFYGQLKAPAVVVLDNYQELPAQSAMHAVLEQAATEAPPGVSIIIISREDPPVEFARLEASDRMTRIQWSDLRLTLEEASAISKQRFDLDARMLHRLHEMTNGWAAGLTLALEQMRRDGEGDQDLRGGAVESVFNYFAGQVFKHASPEVQEFLAVTALFPRITADMAQEITGNAQAGRLLDAFYRRRLFTDRRGSAPYNCQYHDLAASRLLLKPECVAVHRRIVTRQCTGQQTRLPYQLCMRCRSTALRMRLDRWGRA